MSSSMEAKPNFNVVKKNQCLLKIVLFRNKILINVANNLYFFEKSSKSMKENQISM
jgi:hypothetical protein